MQAFEAQATRPVPALLPQWGVSVLESHHSADFRMEMARHDFWQLLYVLRGTGTLHAGERTFALAAGDVAILPASTPHGVEDTPGQPLSLYAVNLSTKLLAGFPTLQPLRADGHRLRHPALSALMPDMLRRLLLEQSLNKPGMDAMMVGLALQLLATLVRLETLPHAHGIAAAVHPRSLPLQARVENYVAELERYFYRSETAGQVATRLGMSRRRFAQLFREVTGTSWLPYVRHLRLEHARRLLRDSSRTVLAVAFECGFEDVSSFYRAFKQDTRLSPDQWRKNHSGEMRNAVSKV